MITSGFGTSSAFDSTSHTISWLRICITPDIDVWNPPNSSESPHKRNNVWTSVPNFILGSSRSSQPRKVASLFSKRARIFSAASFLFTGHRHPIVANSFDDVRDVAVFDYNG